MIRRARPLLGTLVDITVFDKSVFAVTALEYVFSRIEQICDRLSFHSPQSELTNFNLCNSGDVISVSSDFIKVLRCCLEMNRKTNGIFNPAIAPLLQSLRVLPRHHQFNKVHLSPLAEAIKIEGTNEIKIIAKVCSDFGGVAKGYAVDQACEVLSSCGIENALVNAGGDIKAIGRSSHLITIRHPECPERSAHTISIKSQAMATSASYYTRRNSNDKVASSIVNGRNGELCLNQESISIKAQSCMYADALTKAAFFMAEYDLESLLEDFDAEMIITIPDSANVEFGEHGNSSFSMLH